MTSKKITSLNAGQKGIIKGISNLCHGAERRRLLDLGFVPGSEIEMIIKSAFNDPVAYKIKNTVIALRNSQAQQIDLV